MGGYVNWINKWSIREVTQVGDETQLRLGTVLFPPSLDMDQDVLQWSTLGDLYLMLVYENLEFYPKIDEDSLEANPNAAYDFVPKLATNYPVSYEPDGAGGQNQVWTIDLRQGVKWHDFDTSGKYFTADDVVYSLKHVISPWGKNRPVNWTAVNERGGEEILPEDILVTKTGDYQIQFRYVEGYHQTEDFFPVDYLWYSIVPEHVFGPEGEGHYEGWNEDPLEWDGNYIGTGPYKVKEWEPDQYLLLERFDDYWGADVPEVGLPEPKEILVKMYPDNAALFLALDAGEIDCTMDYSAQPEKVDVYKNDPNMEVDIVPDLSILHLGFNLHPTAGYEPLQDVVLRQAIAYAIDEQDIVDVVLEGYGEVEYTFLYNESPNFNPDLTKYDYDPTAAETLLLDAGYTKHA